MSKTAKRSIAMLLVWLQIVLLLTTAMPHTLAVDDTVQSAAATESAATAMATETPALNPVIEGTVRFGSFNYTGDKGTDAAGDERDGVDYVSTFYYSDDYFSASAKNPNATKKTMEWSDLENLSLATLSKDFTIAVYGSSENTFPTVWTNKDKNGKRFLTDCGFTNLFTSAEFNQQTGKDTLGYMFGSKQITVYDQKTQKNKTFTLVAVGVRGAGYGAEWASNLTIGDKSFVSSHKKTYSGTYRHKGFDAGAQKVLTDLRTYTSGITGSVKYWVCGYSRSGAVANLVAGDITKNASTWKTSIDDVYGYTYEAAAGALKSEDPNGTTYPNIHNIINPMDAVPRVSPTLFNHCRLGVDYRVPFHGNAGSNNTAYYTNMRTVLPMVAKIADLYNANKDGKTTDKTEDSVITDSNPETYPYNRTIQMKSFGITNYNSGFVEDVSNAKSKIAPAQGWYLDEFLDSLVPAVINSRAWDAPFFRKTTGGWSASDMKRDDWQSHEKNYVEAYQDALRTLAGDALKNPGMGLGALDGIMDKAMGALDFNTILSGGNLLTQYAAMNLTGGGWGYESSVGRMISPMTYVLNRIIDEVGLFNSEDLNEVHSAIETIMPALTWLYCDDHTYKNGEYLGTAFANVSTILVTHIPELGVSWLMSLDDVFISDYREITLPKSADISMYEFRPGIDGDFSNDAVIASAKAQGALVAEVNGGKLQNNKDARITVKDDPDDSTNVIIRYPGNLDIRFDVRATSEALHVNVADFSPKTNVVNVKSTCEREDKAKSHGLNPSNITTTAIDHNMTTQEDTPDAGDINALFAGETIDLSPKDTLHIMAWHGSNQVAGAYDATYAVHKETQKTVVVDFSGKMTIAANAALAGDASDTNGTFANTGSDVTYQLRHATGSTDYQKFTVADTAEIDGTPSASARRAQQLYWSADINAIPAASIYYDDDLTGKIESDGSGYSKDVQASPATGDFATGQHTFSFTGTGIDIYCTTYDKAKVDGKDVPVGYVQAKLDDKNDTTVTMRNQSDTTRYNVPTISFTGLTNGPHTVTLNILGSSHYKFDGVRIYNSVADQSLYDGTDEKYATFVNLRKALVNDTHKDATESITISDNNAVSGALYVDHPASMGETPTFEAYKTNSPKNEIYLASDKAITFTLSNDAKGGKLWIGLSAPDAGKESGTVSVNNKPIPVTSAVDMYYPITVSSNTVTITNTGTTMISVTNLKITGVEGVYDAAAEAAASQGGASSLNEAVFAPLTMEAIRLAANGGVNPDAPLQDTAKPVWNDGVDNVETLLKAIFRTLLDSLETLFKDVAVW